MKITRDVTPEPVFSNAVLARNNDGMTYSQMEAKTWAVAGKEGSRSAGWWNSVANMKTETPPDARFIPGIAAVLQLPPRRVRELIAEQWYGVTPKDGITRRLRPLMATARSIGDPADIALLVKMAQALSDKSAAEGELEALKREDEGEAEEG